jgi:transcriptional regulator with XRE-family HTH domain
MFDNVSRTLGLLRELRGKSQARLAKDAGVGKSQLSKYETGKELPKFDSLEKVLKALDIGYSEFFYALHLVDRLAAEVEGAEVQVTEASGSQPLHGPLVLEGTSLLGESTRHAFGQVFSDLLLLHHRMIEQAVVSTATPRSARSSPPTAPPRARRRAPRRRDRRG